MITKIKKGFLFNLPAYLATSGLLVARYFPDGIGWTVIIALFAAAIAASIWVYRSNLRNADLPRVITSEEFLTIDHDSDFPGAAVNPMINTAVCARTPAEADGILKEIEEGSRPGPGGEYVDDLAEDVRKQDEEKILLSPLIFIETSNIKDPTTSIDSSFLRDSKIYREAIKVLMILERDRKDRILRSEFLPTSYK